MNFVTRVALALVVLAALGNAGCTPADIAANEAKAKAVLAAINNGVRVTAAAVREGVDAVCANQQAVYDGATLARAAFMTQVGPNTLNNVGNLDKAVVAFNNACAAASNPNATNTAVLLRTAMSAYNSVKAAQAASGG